MRAVPLTSRHGARASPSMRAQSDGSPGLCTAHKLPRPLDYHATLLSRAPFTVTIAASAARLRLRLKRREAIALETIGPGPGECDRIPVRGGGADPRSHGAEFHGRHPRGKVPDRRPAAVERHACPVEPRLRGTKPEPARHTERRPWRRREGLAA